MKLFKITLFVVLLFCCSEHTFVVSLRRRERPGLLQFELAKGNLNFTLDIYKVCQIGWSKKETPLLWLLFFLYSFSANWRVESDRKPVHLSAINCKLTCTFNTSSKRKSIAGNQNFFKIDQQSNCDCWSISRSLLHVYLQRQLYNIHDKLHFLQQNYEINKIFQQMARTKFFADVEHVDFHKPNESARIYNDLTQNRK